MDDKVRPDSIVRLRIDVASARILVWVASTGRDADLTSEADLYFFDRYQRLAACYRRRGCEAQAREMEVKADEHAHHGGWDGPPVRRRDEHVSAPEMVDDGGGEPPEGRAPGRGRGPVRFVAIWPANQRLHPTAAAVVSSESSHRSGGRRR